MKIPYLVFEPELPEAPVRAYLPDPGVYVIGLKAEECDIALKDAALAKQHALLIVRDNGVVSIMDWKSKTGVMIDGRRITSGITVEIGPEKNITLGTHLFYLADRLKANVNTEPIAPRIYAKVTTAQIAELCKRTMIFPGDAVSKHSATESSSRILPENADIAPECSSITVDLQGIATKAREKRDSPRKEQSHHFPKMPEIPEEHQVAVDHFIYHRIKPLFDQLFRERTGGNRLTLGGDAGALRKATEEVLLMVLKQQAKQIPPALSMEDAVKWCVASFMDYGPLQGLLGDSAVTEIMVNGVEDIYIERQGRLTKSHLRFWDGIELRRVIEKMVMITNRRIDEQQPYQDTRLEDGSRVNVIIRPLALSGDSITIRKFPNQRLWIEDLIGFESLSEDMAEFLERIVVHRANVIVSGGTGSGKTTLLNVLSNFIPKDERLVSIEDSAELRLNQPNKVTLESRPKSAEGTGAVTIRDLVINSLRMRPDRIIVGECRGGEAMDMLQAMNTGHDGSLTTLHANSPRDALGRLETMCLMSGMELPAKAIRGQIASAVNFIVQQSRIAGGLRKVTSITEVVGMEGDQVVMQEVFRFVRVGTGEDGKAKGHFEATGVVPQYVAKLQEDRIGFPVEMFNCKGQQQ